MDIEIKVLNCGESGTTARCAMITAASGGVGEGVFVFTGEGRLPKRGFNSVVNCINAQAVKRLLGIPGMFGALSLAIPANREYRMPITIYVGNTAIRELIRKINSGEYDYFQHALDLNWLS
jgi:hypothetical protein